MHEAINAGFCQAYQFDSPVLLVSVTSSKVHYNPFN